MFNLILIRYGKKIDFIRTYPKRQVRKVMETCQLKSMEMPLESFLLLRYVSCYNQEHDGKKV